MLLFWQMTVEKQKVLYSSRQNSGKALATVYRDKLIWDLVLKKCNLLNEFFVKECETQDRVFHDKIKFTSM